MTISTKDCTQYIADWVSQNSDLLPKDEFAIQARELGKTHIKDGTQASNWKRRAKKKIDDVTYRAFEGGCDIFDSELIFVLHEQNGQITKLEYGTREDFEGKYFDRISYSFG